jgi:hypothetical protein
MVFSHKIWEVKPISAEVVHQKNASWRHVLSDDLTLTFVGVVACLNS